MNATPPPIKDVIVIGAGPAGMSAAIEARRQGLDVLVLDEQPEPGGQIYRGVRSNRMADKSVLGPDYHKGAELVDAFLSSGAEYRAGATVWEVGAELRVAYSKGGSSHFVKARDLILATGAIERPMPIPGWTLPGVMTLGGAQIMLKTAAAVPTGRFIIAGEGPLLYLSTAQLIRAGAPPAAILETGDRSPAGVFSRDPLAALAGARAIGKGLRWIRMIAKAGIPRHGNVRDLEAHGEGRFTHVTFRTGQQTHRLEAESLFLHQGVVPHLNLAGAAGCDFVWGDHGKMWKSAVTEIGAASRKNVYAVGDGAEILGADVAQSSGRLAVLELVRQRNASAPDVPPTTEMGRLHRAIGTERRFRRALDQIYTPPQDYLVPQRDSAIVCRCEEVTAGDLRGAVGAGCCGVNQLKFFTRAGMGPCQGRSCGLTITLLMAAATGQSPAKIGYMNLRSPVKPITLGELAKLAEESEA